MVKIQELADAVKEWETGAGRFSHGTGSRNPLSAPDRLKLPLRLGLRRSSGFALETYGQVGEEKEG